MYTTYVLRDALQQVKYAVDENSDEDDDMFGGGKEEDKDTEFINAEDDSF